MSIHGRLSLAALAAVLLAACTSAPKPAAGEDSIRLVGGEVVRGRIVEENARQVVLEHGDVVSAYPRGSISAIDYSRPRWEERSRALPAAEAPTPNPQPSSSWLPRRDPREPVKQTEVLFYDAHAVGDCVGAAIEKTLRELPDFRLFVEPGGRVVLQDPKQWGYHAHLPGAALRVPSGKPGLSIELPRDEASLPDSITFVSPAQEIRAGEGDARASYAPPDAVHAVLSPASLADTVLAIQPFAGGRPATTPNGTLWAFTLPRNARQFFVYLFDPERRHGEILKAAYAAFGDTVLAPDLIVDLHAADGAVNGRVLLLPYPDRLSADGPALEALAVYAGPTKDPTLVTTLALPPREALQLPPKAASTKADVLVSHYEVLPSIPQAIVLAHGIGRPGKDASVVERALTPKDPDQIVKIDLSPLPEERFPAVAWLYQRRAFVWKSTGGYLAPPSPALVPPRRGEARLHLVKRSEGIPHVVPLLFLGPRPAATVVRGADPLASVAGGMANGLLRDAIWRESMGSASTPSTLPIQPGAAPADAGFSNVTYVNILSPPHTASADPMSGYGGGYPGTSGLYGVHYQPTGGGAAMFAPGNSGSYVMRPAGSLDASSGAVTERGGGAYDPRTGSFGPSGNTVGADAAGTPLFLFNRRR